MKRVLQIGRTPRLQVRAKALRVNENSPMFPYLRLFPALLLLTFVTACSSIGHVAVLKATDVPHATKEVFAASIRSRTEDGRWGWERSDRITFSRYEISVPPGRAPGQSPRFDITVFDPARDFVVGESRDYAGAAEFGAAVKAAAPADGAFILVHGFKTGYTNSLYQLAQIASDIRMPAASILYAWPAQKRVSGYLRDSREALDSRDGLIELVEGLARSGVRRIVLAAYSLGAPIVVEALRKMEADHSPALRRLGGVLMLVPDMDMDAFHEAAVEMGGLPQPFIVVGSPDDMPLNLVSSLTSRGKPRLGMLPTDSKMTDLDLIYLDVGAVPQIKQNGHLPIATSPSLIAAINAMNKPDIVHYAEAAAHGQVPGATVKHFGALTYVTLPPP